MAKRGRPSKYPSDLPDKLPDLMAEGATLVEVCAELRVPKQTFYDWLHAHPDLAQAYELGKTLAEAFDTKRYRTWMMKLAPGNASGIIFYMKNRYGWSETPPAQKAPDEIAQAIREAIREADEATCAIPTNASLH